MTHFASYWQLFDAVDEALVVDGWRVRGKSRLADARKGDILWLFTSGSKCRLKLDEEELPEGGVEDNLAYLAEVFTVKGISREEVGPFALLVEGISDKCIGLCPPILIDDIVRPDGWGKEKPIGSLRQGAWRLPVEIADQLQEILKREMPEVYQEVFGGSRPAAS